MSASHQIERPIAKPMKPSTGAACCSQWSTFSSEAPRPSSTDVTPSRPSPVRVWLDQHLGVLLRVDALDLPDVDLDAVVLDLLDRAPHQLRAQLGVVAVGVAADRLELVVLGRHQQLEEELAVVLVQPVGELLEAAELALVHLRVAVGVADARGPSRSPGRCRGCAAPKSSSYWKSNSVLAGLLDRLGELEAVLAGELRDVRAELLVDEHAGGVGVDAALDRDLHALVDQLLGVADRLRLLRRSGSPSIPNIFFWNEPRWSKARM